MVAGGFSHPKNAKKFLPFSSLTSLYVSIVESNLQYCCPVRGCAGTTEIYTLQKLQNRAVRIVPNSSFETHSNPSIEIFGRRTSDDKPANMESKNIGL